MPVVLDKTELTVEEIVQAVRQTEPCDIPAAILDMTARCPAAIPQIESELIAAIHIPLPDAIRQRYRALIRKRERYAITPEELAELLTLNNDVEIRHSERICRMAALAKLRGTTLRAVMADLGIEPGSYA